MTQNSNIQLPPTKNITVYACTENLSQGSLELFKYGVRTDYEILEIIGPRSHLETLGKCFATFYSQNPKTELNNCIPIITEPGYRKLSFLEEKIFLSALKNSDNAKSPKRITGVDMSFIALSLHASYMLRSR